MHALPAKWFKSLAIGLGALLLASGGQAALLNDVSVTLYAPGGDYNASTGFPYFQLAPLASGIAAGDGGDIGAYMLSGEQISFSGNAILLHVAAGWDDGLGHLSTGILGAGGEHARYVLDGLAIAGQKIVGLQVYAFDGYGSAGFSGLASPADPASYVQLLNPHSISFNLDELLFKDRGNGSSNAYGEFRIDLLTTPVPEPAAGLLMLAGLGLLMGLRRRAP